MAKTKAPPIPDILTRFSVSKAVPASMTTDELLKCAARLDLAKRQVEDDEKAVKARLDEIEPLLIERMLANDNPRATVLGITIHIRRELWASAVDVMGLKKWLGRNKATVPNADTIVKESANTQTLSAMTRELIAKRKNELGIKALGKRPEELLPPKLVPLLRLSEKVKLGFRQA